MPKSGGIWQQLNAAMSSFVRVELEVGLAFAQAAADADCVDELLHNRYLARKAYNESEKLMHHVCPKRLELRELQKRRSQLQSALRKLGDPCVSFPVRRISRG